MPVMRIVAALVAFGATSPYASAGSSEPPTGAVQCSGCHAASPKVDTTIPRLIGHSAADIVSQMQAFKTGQKQSTIMDRLAKGFSDAEIRAIAEWYALQK